MTALRLLITIAVLSALVSGSAHAEGRRVAVIIGSNRGLYRENSLRFAESDARAQFEVLVEMGNFAREDTTLLLRPTAIGVLQAVAAAAHKIRGAPDGLLLVYYSGHGNAAELHMNDTVLSREALAEQLESARLGFTLVVIDSCRSEAAKGFAREPEATGRATLQAASIGQNSVEVEALRSGLFSYHWLSALRGAADGGVNGHPDGVVDLEEAWRYTRQAVRAGSVDIGIPQTPVDDAEWHLSDPPPLTWVWKSVARVVLPSGRDAYYRVVPKGGDGQTLFAIAGRPSTTELALPEGQFVVHRFRTGHRHSAVEIVVRPKATIRLDHDDFGAESEPVTFGKVTLKGDVSSDIVGRAMAGPSQFALTFDGKHLGDALNPNQLRATVGAQLYDDGTLGQSIAFDYTHGTSGWLPIGSFIIGLRDIETTWNVAERRILTVAGGIEYRTIVNDWTGYVSFQAGGSLIEQRTRPRRGPDAGTSSTLGFSSTGRTGFSVATMSSQLAVDFGFSVMSTVLTENNGGTRSWPTIEAAATLSAGAVWSF